MFSEAEVVTLVETVRVEELRAWVREGWIIPAAGERGPRFDELDVARIRLVCELRSELDVPEEMVPMVLSLLDQVHCLRGELRRLVEAVDAQPDTVRAAISAAYLKRRSQRGSG